MSKIEGYVEDFEWMPTDTNKVTRIVVVNPFGRIVDMRDVSVELSLQDDGRTLKVFINDVAKEIE